MSADSINGPRPPIREISKPKPKTEVKKTKTPSPSTEHKPTILEFFRNLRDTAREKINHIITKDQSPQQTLKDLSAIEIPQDTQEPAKPTTDQTTENNPQSTQETPQQSPPEKPSVPEPIIHDHAADQAEITRIKQTIKNLEEPTPQPTETTPEAPLPKLFPDRPSLYEQHHEAYDQELKKIDGKINRIKDIFELKKAGVRKARYTYDGLRSRGITRDQIMKNDTGEFPRISRTLTTRGFDDSKKEYRKIYSYTDLPKNIDRLYSIGEFDLDSFSSDKKSSHTIQIASFLSKLTDEQFQQTRDKLNNFHFLSGSYNIRFFYTKELPVDIYESLLYLQKEYFSNPQNETKFKSFLSSEQHQFDEPFNCLDHQYHSDGITNLVKNLIESGVNDDKKIEIPSELLKFAKEDELNFLRCLSTLETREQQQYLTELTVDRYNNRTSEKIKQYFDQFDQPTLSFFQDAILYSEKIDHPIVIPKNLLDSINDSFSKNFFTELSSLQDIDIQKVLLNYKQNSNNNDLESLFTNKHLNLSFYIKYLTDPNYQPKPIIKEHLANLSQESQQEIILISKITSPSTKESVKIRETLFKYSDIHTLFDDQNNPNFAFFKLVFALNEYRFKQSDFLKLNLTKDVLSKFSPKEQMAWQFILDNQYDYTINYQLPYLIFSPYNSGNLDSFFGENLQPTSYLFEQLINSVSQVNFNETNFFSLHLTPDKISSFSPEDQKMWNSLLQLKTTDVDTDIFKFVFNNKAQIDSFFNDKNQPTNTFFKTLAQVGLFKPEFFTFNLTPDILSSFSPEEQRFWKNLPNLNNINPTIVKILVSVGLDVKLLFNEQDQPTSRFFEELAKSGQFELQFFKSNLTSEVLASFSPENQIFWKAISKLPNSNSIKMLFSYKSDYLSLINDDFSVNTLFLKKYIINFPYSVNSFINQEFLSHRPNSELLFWKNIEKLPEKLTIPILKNLITDTGDISYDHIFFKILSQDDPTFFSPDFALNQEIGKAVVNSSELNKLTIFSNEINRLQDLISSNPDIQLNQDNWQSILMTYIQIHTEMNIYDGLPNISNNTTEKINQIFSESSVKNFCLKELQSEWIMYLKSEKPEAIPSSIYLISKFIELANSAGPLSQIESLSRLINSISLSLESSSTTPQTKSEIINGLSELESRFNREKWSNENKTNFYNISTDIINADPSLFSDYLTLLKKFNSEDLKRFNEEIYPLYKTKLVLIEQDSSNTQRYKIEDLVELKEEIRSFTSFQTQKEKLLLDIKNSFKDRFGLINIPEKFSQENIRSIKNVSMYLGNLNARDSQKEAILSYYLSLMVNNKWSDFRNGEFFDISNYLSGEKKSILDPILSERQKIINALITTAGIDSTDSSEFIRLIQNETQVLRLGEIETIDIKLNNIIRNLEELQDLDLYPDAIDKERMKLLQTWGNKKVGSVAARLYQQASNSSKTFSFSEEELQIKSDIEIICQNNSINLSDPEAVKSIFQDEIKQFSVIVNISNTIKDLSVSLEIERLRQKLDPPSEIVKLFDQLGEKFTTNSGVIPVTQDVDYLENLIIKNETTITPEDKQLASDYIYSVRSQIIKLEEIYDQIKSKFENLKHGNGSTKNDLLDQKLEEITKAINQSNIQQPITSVATNNLNDVIENMRACLSCTQKGCNNDTDLTFGDVNKFYLYSKMSDSSKGSISDQIAYLEPITKSNGSTEISFVIDNLYGVRNPSILEGHIDTLLKKIEQIKAKLPKSKISIFVSNAALSSSGTATSNLVKKYQDSGLNVNEEDADINVLQSSFGDHYIEIGGHARNAGVRKVKGIIINR